MSDDDLLNFDFGSAEALHRDLVPYLREIDGLGPCIQSPLVYSVPHGDAFNPLINRQYIHKKRLMDEAVTQQNYRRYVTIHEKPYRTRAILECQDWMTDAVYWQYVGETWILADAIHPQRHDWRRLWHSKRPGRRDNVMKDCERAAFVELPQAVVMYRAVGCEAGIQGLSWSLDRDIAISLARRYAAMAGPYTYVARGVADRNRVLAHFTRRNEAEIVIQPNHVHNITIDRIRRKPLGR